MKTFKFEIFNLGFNNKINEMFLLDSKLLIMILMFTKIRLRSLIVNKVDENYSIIPTNYYINNIIMDNMDFINIFKYDFFVKLNN